MGKNDGWVKLHRDLLEKPIWSCSTLEQKAILITILMLANHKDKQWEWKGKKFTCGPGQFVTSSFKLAKAAGASRQNVRTALARFEKYEFLTYESTKTGILVTIVNWGKYQSKSNQTNQQANQQVTNTQPTGNQQVTTNKNDKNDKNDKKDIYTLEFEHFWSIYPKHIEKKRAYKCWNTCLKNGHKPDDIIRAATNYARFCTSQKTESKFIKHAATFLGPNKPFLDFVTGIPPDARGHPPDEPKGFQAIRDWLSGEGKELNVFE